MMKTAEELTSEIVAKLKKMTNLKAFAPKTNLSYPYLNQVKNERRGLGLKSAKHLSRVLELEENNPEYFQPSNSDRHAQLTEQTNFLDIPMLGYVAAGIPSAPDDSVDINNDLAHIRLDEDSWRVMFPQVEPKNIAALRVSGTSMAPKHNDRDLIFVRQTEDISEVRDGDRVILLLPDAGYTFKVWHSTGVLTGINPEFKAIPCPKRTKLWGIYVCGTKTE